MALDRRRVQTAVIGHADSELPVVLPMEAIELDDFRARHTGQTYWCGVWLGGCGQQLTTKLYTDRACHFAHHPHTTSVSVCRRKASGVSSADHLYIKPDMLRWFAEQDIPATAEIQRTADGAVGGSVLFTSETGDGLRVLLADDHGIPLTDQAPGHVLVTEALAYGLERALRDHGYVNLIRCVPDGTRRRIEFGTKTYDGVTWFDPSECELAPEGLSTPAVKEIRRLRTTQRPLGPRTTKPPAPAAAQPVMERAAADPRSEYNRAAVMEGLQRAVTDGRSLTKLRLCLERAEAATRSGATAEENTLMRSAGDALLRLERGVGIQPSSTPSRYAVKRRTRLGPPTAGLGTVPKLRIGSAKSPSPTPPSQQGVRETPVPIPRQDRATERDQVRAKELKAGAAAVRGALKKAAREQTHPSWAKLRDQLGSALPRLRHAEQVEVLYLADKDTPADEPMLSTVLAVSDPSVLPAFREAAARLGLELPDDPQDLRDVLDADLQQLHTLWRLR